MEAMGWHQLAVSAIAADLYFPDKNILPSSRHRLYGKPKDWVEDHQKGDN